MEMIPSELVMSKNVDMQGLGSVKAWYLLSTDVHCPIFFNIYILSLKVPMPFPN